MEVFGGLIRWRIHDLDLMAKMGGKVPVRSFHGTFGDIPGPYRPKSSTAVTPFERACSVARANAVRNCTVEGGAMIEETATMAVSFRRPVGASGENNRKSR